MKTNTNRIVSLIICAFGAITAHAGYLGASAGYIVDGGGDKLFAVQSGTAFAEGELGSHLFELELAYLDSSESLVQTIDGVTVTGGGEVEIIPLMANYLLRSKASRDLSFYGGVGLGYSFYDVSATARASGVTATVADSGGMFTWQLMLGVQYHFSATKSLKLGYRYVAFEDVTIIFEDAIIDGDLYAIDRASYDASGDESILEVGLIFKF